MTKARTGEVKDEGSSAFRVQLVDSETGKLVGEPRNPKLILAEIDRTHYYLLQVTRDQEVPIVKVMSKKDAYLKSKAGGGGAGKTVASQPPAEVQISWLVTEHDLSHKLESGKRHLSKKGPGSRVSITITTKKGRKWTSGQEEDKLAVVKKIEDLMTAADAGGAGESSAPAVRVRRKGDVKWVEPNKVGATIVFEAYK
jgi:translation initiation factor IF-3